jgi:hypothetical protein
MRHFHKQRNHYHCPIVNLDKLWALVGEEVRCTGSCCGAGSISSCGWGVQRQRKAGEHSAQQVCEAEPCGSLKELTLGLHMHSNNSSGSSSISSGCCCFPGQNRQTAWGNLRSIDRAGPRGHIQQDIVW